MTVTINYSYLIHLSKPVGFQYSKLACGDLHTCLINNGDVYCFGRNNHGQSAQANGIFQVRRPVLVAGITDALYIASGEAHTCVVTKAKTVYCFGEVILDSGNEFIPVLIEGITTAVEIWAEEFLTCVKLESGEVTCFGYNQVLKYLVGEPVPTDDYFDVPVNLTYTGDAASKMKPGSAKQICAVSGTNLDLRCIGHNEYGELGDGTDEPQFTLDIAPVLSGVHDFEISSTGRHMCAIYGVNRQLSCWGTNYYGNEEGSIQEYFSPRDIAGVQNGHSVSVGKDFVCVLLKTHEVVCFGLYGYGQVGSGLLYENPAGFIGSPTYVSGLTDVTELSSGSEHSCASTKDNRYFCWGRNRYGQVGAGVSNDSSVAVLSQPGSGIIMVAHETTCLFSPLNYIRCFGALSGSIIFTGMVNSLTSYKTARTYSSFASTITGLSIGRAFICVVHSTGRVRCEGENYSSQLGAGNNTHPLVGPVEVVGITTATSVSSCAYYSCAVLTGGTIKCWGTSGGIGFYDQSPTLIPGIIGATRVITAEEFLFVLFGNGSIACLGDNSFGRFGDGTTDYASVPRVVRNGVLSVATGYSHTCIIDTAKRVRCAGLNEDGQLGLALDHGDTATFNNAIPNIENAAKVVTGALFTCVLMETSLVVCFGTNENGQLGDGSYLDSYLPIEIPLTGVVDLSAGESHVCFKTSDGKNYCQGDNRRLQLGNGGVYEAPIEVFLM